jgi:hypothetical protein
VTTITAFSSFFFSSKNVLRHLASLMPLLRKEEGRMLRRTTDTCHIAGPTTVSSKIIGFTSFGCFRGVYIFSSLVMVVTSTLCGGSWGDLFWVFFGHCMLLLGVVLLFMMSQKNMKKEKGTCHCYLGFILLHSLISII